MNNQQTIIYSFHSVLSALKAHADCIQVIYTQENRSDRRMESLLALANQQHVSVQNVSQAELVNMIGGVNHQGIVAVMTKIPSYDEAFLLDYIKELDKPCLLLVLDGVQDPHNLGACLRSAAAFGADAVVVSKDRAVGMTPVVERVACGAAQVLPLVTVINLARFLQSMQQQGVWLVGLDAGAGQPLSELDLKVATALIMGGEGSGLRRLTKKHCDFEASIPLTGVVESLNVSAAAAIALYEAVRQRV